MPQPHKHRTQDLHPLALALVGVWVAACGQPLADEHLSIELSVEAVSPELIPARGGVEVTVIGKNFEPGVELSLDDDSVTSVIVHDEGRLTFWAPSARVGAKDLALSTPGGLRLVVPAAVRYYAEQIAYQNEVVLFAHEGLENLVLGDSDGDGLDDAVVVLRSDDAYSILSYLTGSEGLSSTLAEVVADGTTSRRLVRVDLNDDGLVDLVDRQGYFLAEGEGRFSERRGLGQYPTQIGLVAADVNGDGRSEVAFITGEAPSYHLVLGALNASGAFEERSSLPLVDLLEVSGDDPIIFVADAANGSLSPLAAGDLNGDGAADLVLAFQDLSDGNNLGMLAGLLGPDLDPTQGWILEAPWHALADPDLLIGDMDSDGNADVIWDNPGLGRVGLYAGLGDGTVEPGRDLGRRCSQGSLLAPPYYGAPATTLKYFCGRYGQDKELVTYYIDPWTGSLSTLSRTDIPDAEQVALGFVDGDEHIDLVATDRTGVTRASYGTDSSGTPDLDPEFLPYPGLLIQGPGGANLGSRRRVNVAPGRFGPGLDVAVEQVGDVLFASLNSDLPQAQIRAHLGTPITAESLAMGACDLTGDGVDELIVLSKDSQLEIRIYEVRQGGLHPLDALACQADWYSSTLGCSRFERGGGNRLVLIDGVSGVQTWHLSSAQYLHDELDLEGENITLADIDGDGLQDLVGEALGSDGLWPPKPRLWHNEGDGTFTSLDISVPPLDIEMGRVLDWHLTGSNDGLQCWVMVRIEDGPPTQLIGLSVDASGEASLLTRATYPYVIDMDAAEFRLADANGDGIADLFVMPVNAPGGIGVLDAAGIVTEWRTDVWVSRRSRLVVRDFDVDGLADILLLNENAPNKVNILWNVSR